MPQSVGACRLRPAKDTYSMSTPSWSLQHPGRMKPSETKAYFSFDTDCPLLASYMFQDSHAQLLQLNRHHADSEDQSHQKANAAYAPRIAPRQSGVFAMSHPSNTITCWSSHPPLAAA